MLLLNITPRDATVFLNRESYDATRDIYLLPGTYRIEIIRDGYETHSENIIVERDQSIEKSVELIRLYGGFRYSSSPTSATANLRNSAGQIVETWAGLKSFESLPVDEYTLTVTEPGYQSHQEQLRVESNRILERRVILRDVQVAEELSNAELSCPPSIEDGDGNIYRVVQIGMQCWMAENLKSTVYQNNDLIQNVISIDLWQNIKDGAFANYNNENSIPEMLGILYNWHAVNDERNICPIGWKVPSDQDWQVLESFLGLGPSELTSFGERIGVDYVGGKLKSQRTVYWDSPNEHASDEYQFSALPGGLRLSSGHFANINMFGYWWSSTSSSSENSAIRRSLSSSSGSIARTESNKNDGYSVRCIMI